MDSNNEVVGRMMVRKPYDKIFFEVLASGSALLSPDNFDNNGEVIGAFLYYCRLAHAFSFNIEPIFGKRGCFRISLNGMFFLLNKKHSTSKKTAFDVVKLNRILKFREVD